MSRQKQLCLILLVFLLGCGLYQTRTDKLKEAVTQFNEGVRWGRMQDVISRLDPQIKAHFIEMHKDFGRAIKITECEIVNSAVSMEKGVSEVGIRIVWYRIDEMEVHETVVSQRWEEQKGKWLMVAEEYRSGTPF
jgi:hypothetical protein